MFCGNITGVLFEETLKFLLIRLDAFRRIELDKFSLPMNLRGFELQQTSQRADRAVEKSPFRYLDKRGTCRESQLRVQRITGIEKSLLASQLTHWAQGGNVPIEGQKAMIL